MTTSALDLPHGRGPHPAIIGLHPADDASRDHYLFLHLAKVLPPRGMAVARFDRRGFDVPFEDQIADTLEVLADLTRRPEIDPSRIGLWGFSQGAWIAPMVAARMGEIAFLVLVASVGVTPAAQMIYGTAKHVREVGFTSDEPERVVRARKTVDEYRRGRASLASAQVAIDAIKDEPFFEQAYLPREARELGPWQDMDFDPEPIFAQVRCPVLLFYGDDDEWQPIDESVAAWQRAAERSGNRDVTIVRLSGAAHAPTLGRGKSLDAVAPEYERALLTWLARVAGLRA